MPTPMPTLDIRELTVNYAVKGGSCRRSRRST